jgi:hypothetical protein
MREPTPKPLRHFLDREVAVIATHGDGRTIGSWKDRENFTTEPEVVAKHWKAGKRRFQLHPYYHGLLCFDIDRKGGKDGLQELYRVFHDKGLVLPSYLADLETFPALTTTPSGGLHLYFRYDGGKRYKSGEIAPGLEAVHYNHLLTAPGSRKDSGEYVFYGSLDDAPRAPVVLLRFLTEYRDPEKLKKRPTWTYDKPDRGPLSLDDIAGILDRQGEYSPGASRNRYAFELAKFAGRKGYSASEVEGYIRERYEAEDFPAREIAATVESAYRRVTP